ncbi:MAG: homocysteine S-methyltransferase family protein, partial [Terriglobia bacterium]
MSQNESHASPLASILRERIVLLDGAMGTMIQARNLAEADYRGKQFASHARDLRLNNDLLNITQPQIIEDIHYQYLQAGADIIETNTFNSTTVSMAEYGLEDHVSELNAAGAAAARRAVRKFTAEDPERRCFVAGSIGPTSRTASVSQDVANPASRGTSFEQLRAAYYEQAGALVEGGVDLLLLETVFDTLNAKAALFAIEQYFEESGRRLPVMVSVTIVDQSGRTLSGQTIEAFWNSISHIPLLSVGINCALGAKQMRPYIEELSQIAPVHISCHPNAGLPNAFGGFDETPESMAQDLGEFAANGW